MSFLEQWKDLIRNNAIYPEHSEINCAPPDKMLIDWPLGDDPHRPSKRSKSIILTFTREFQDDYSSADAQNKRDKNDTLIITLQEHFKTFNPSHSNPYNIPPPSEEITVR